MAASRSQLYGTIMLGNLHGDALRKNKDKKMKLITGVSSLPPLNAEIAVRGPIMTDEEHNKSLQNLLKSTGLLRLPEQFSWLNRDDYLKYFGIDEELGILTTPVHQHNCGACWSIAAATAFSDRYAIANRLPKSPDFSHTAIMAGCNPASPDPSPCTSSQSCCGGVLFEAIDYICKIGVPTHKCMDASWMCPHSTTQTFDECGACKTDELVSASCTDISNQMPPDATRVCSNKCTFNGQTLQCEHPNLYKRSRALNGSALSIGSNVNPTVAIQGDIFVNGPLPVTFMVYAGFVVGSTPDSNGKVDGWQKTKGVYINVPGFNIYNYPPVPVQTAVKCQTINGLLCDCACMINDYCKRGCAVCVDTLGNSCDCNCLTDNGTRCDPNCKLELNNSQTVHPDRAYMGNHSVVIVGWGVENDVTFTAVDYLTNEKVTKTFEKLPYWIVRNSWGPCWLEKNADNLEDNPWGAPPGFFKVAMYQKDTFGPGQGINECLYIDHIGFQIDPSVGRVVKVGGGVTFKVQPLPDRLNMLKKSPRRT